MRVKFIFNRYNGKKFNPVISGMILIFSGKNLIFNYVIFNYKNGMNIDGNRSQLVNFKKMSLVYLLSCSDKYKRADELNEFESLSLSLDMELELKYIKEDDSFYIKNDYAFLKRLEEELDKSSFCYFKESDYE